MKRPLTAKRSVNDYGGKEARLSQMPTIDEEAAAPLGSAATPTFKHPIQVLNELSPQSSTIKIPSLQVKQKINEPQKANEPPTTAKDHVEEKPVIVRESALIEDKPTTSFSTTLQAPLTPVKSPEVIKAASVIKPARNRVSTDPEILAKALMAAEYEPLKDQLSNLPAAKSSGNFVFQVAASVDALFKCSSTVKATEEHAMNDLHANSLKKVSYSFQNNKNVCYDIN